MVLVVHTHRFVFLKTNKTAGTSIEMFLQSLCAPSGTAITERQHAQVKDDYIAGMRLVRPRDKQPQDSLWYNHMPAIAVRAQLGADLWDAYVKVTSVRNPLDLAVSRFHYCRKVGGEQHSGESLTARRSAFKEVILDTKWTNSMAATHINDTLAADRIIRFEQLTQDVETFCKDQSINIDAVNLPVTKRTVEDREDIHFREYYDDETVDFVRSHLDWMFQAGSYPDTPHDPSC
jgi:hypothetical protein